MNVVTIPRSHIQSEHGKEYTVFEISIQVQGRTHEVQKRYSELFVIHKLLKKQVNVPQFPRKSIRNLNSKVIESRRIALEHYLQWIVSHDPHCTILLDYLKIPHFYNADFSRSQSIDSLESHSFRRSHATVIYFKSLDFLVDSDSDDNTVPDIIYKKNGNTGAGSSRTEKSKSNFSSDSTALIRMNNNGNRSFRTVSKTKKVILNA